MIMERKLKVRLRVLIPAVENSISGAAFRPRDVYRSRKGLTRRDRQHRRRRPARPGRRARARRRGRAGADRSISRTLTGAARVALGPDLPPFYTDDDALAADDRAPCRGGERSALAAAAVAALRRDARIRKWPTSTTSAPAAWAAPITAALFLRKFVARRRPGCTSTSSPGRRRPSRAGPRAANARPRARSTRCSRALR